MSEASRAAGTRAQGRVGTVVNGKWTIDERIGSGGMATVYAATHANGGRAALKVLHPQLSRNADIRARFLREAYVANAVSHPGIVGVIDDDVTEDGGVFLVLELLEGETLETKRLRLGGAIAIDEALDVADQALSALAAAHAKGIVHRDVKPDNVFLTTAGRVKLLDFGLARLSDGLHEQTQAGVTIGTPEFMPPEQARGRREAVDARSDVWGLGATLFTCMTGTYVHHAETLRDQLLASATQRARPIRTLVPDVPEAIARVIDRALELEMDDRWPTATDMQQALRAARGDVSVVDRTQDSVTLHAARRAGDPHGPLDPRAPISSVNSLAAISSPISSPTALAFPIAPPSEPTLDRPQVIAPRAPDTTVSLPPATARLGAQLNAGQTLLLSTTPSSTPAVRAQSPMPMVSAAPAQSSMPMTSAQVQSSMRMMSAHAQSSMPMMSAGQAPSAPAISSAPISPTVAMTAPISGAVGSAKPTTPRMSNAPEAPATASTAAPAPPPASAPARSSRAPIVAAILLFVLAGVAMVAWMASRGLLPYRF